MQPHPSGCLGSAVFLTIREAEAQFKMKFTLIFTLSLISGYVVCVDVFGCSGRSVLISCHYSTKFAHLPKVVCRRARICETRIKTEAKNLWVCDNNFQMYDDPAASVIRVLVRDLSPQDAGPYRCAAVQDTAYITTGDWELNVEDDPYCEESKTVTGLLGQTVSFRCEYSETNKHKPKCLLKMQDHSIEQVINTTGGSWGRDRFSISDNRTSTMFQVSIREVTTSDAGVYFCSVCTSGNTISYTSGTTNIQLFVTETSSNSIKRATQGPQGTSDTHQPAGTSRISIIVYVCVSLMLIGVLALMFYKLRYKEKHGSTHLSSERKLKNTTVNDDYEDTYATLSFQDDLCVRRATLTFFKDESTTEYSTVKHIRPE